MRFLSKPHDHDTRNWYRRGQRRGELGRRALRTACSKTVAGGEEARMFWSGCWDTMAALVRGKRLGATSLPSISRRQGYITDTGLGVRPLAFPMAIRLNTELTALFFIDVKDSVGSRQRTCSRLSCIGKWELAAGRPRIFGCLSPRGCFGPLALPSSARWMSKASNHTNCCIGKIKSVRISHDDVSSSSVHGARRRCLRSYPLP